MDLGYRQGDSDVISFHMPAGSHRHLVGITLRNVCYSVTEIRSVG